MMPFIPPGGGTIATLACYWSAEPGHWPRVHPPGPCGQWPGNFFDLLISVGLGLIEPTSLGS